MATAAVRKEVVSIGYFLPSFCLQWLQFFYLLDQIKSNCMYWLHWKSEKSRIEPNELDELKCSKSLNQITSYAHWHAFLYLHAQIKTFVYLSYLKSEKGAELNGLEYLKTSLDMSSYAHWHAFSYLFV